MITPINKAPREFMKRYAAILRGDERLDTVKEIADFWRFAVEQGKPHPEMREYIANCVILATNRPGLDSPVPVGEPLYEAYSYWDYCMRLSSWAPEPGDTKDGRTLEEFYDFAWAGLELWVKELNEKVK